MSIWSISEAIRRVHGKSKEGTTHLVAVSLFANFGWVKLCDLLKEFNRAGFTDIEAYGKNNDDKQVLEDLNNFTKKGGNAESSTIFRQGGHSILTLITANDRKEFTVREMLSYWIDDVPTDVLLHKVKLEEYGDLNFLHLAIISMENFQNLYQILNRSSGELQSEKGYYHNEKTGELLDHLRFVAVALEKGWTRITNRWDARTLVCELGGDTGLLERETSPDSNTGTNKDPQSELAYEKLRLAYNTIWYENEGEYYSDLYARSMGW